MSTKDEALKLALEALKAETDPNWECNSYHPKVWEAITAIKQALAEPVQELAEYNAGLLNDYGGGNVEWWQDYIRSELSRAYDYYQSQL